MIGPKKKGRESGRKERQIKGGERKADKVGGKKGR